jgi:hypothetical protein
MARLERGLPTAAFDEYLASDETTVPLLGTLTPGTDSDLLIDLIKDAGRADALAIKPYFTTDANLSAIGRLALKLNRFVDVEKKAALLEKQEQKNTLRMDRAERIAAAMEKEREASVSAATGGLFLSAAVATSQAAAEARLKTLRQKVERDGVQIVVTLPANLQTHMQYLVDHLQEVLLDMAPHPPYLGAKLISHEQVFKAGKGKTMGGMKKQAETKQALKIHVPGVVVAQYLSEREELGERELLFTLRQVQGPYCQAQFMSHVSEHKAESEVPLHFTSLPRPHIPWDPSLHFTSLLRPHFPWNPPSQLMGPHPCRATGTK